MNKPDGAAGSCPGMTPNYSKIPTRYVWPRPRFQAGLRVETNCQNCGFQQVRINGLDGPYTQLLLDGKALFSSLNGVYGIEQIPAGMIERVEVMRGGGSALYGANAIGGTVNIITKEPLNNLFMISHNLIAIGNSAYDNTTSLNASLINGQRNAGLYIFGTSRHRQHYDHDGDHFSEIGELKLTTLGSAVITNLLLKQN